MDESSADEGRSGGDLGLRQPASMLFGNPFLNGMTLDQRWLAVRYRSMGLFIRSCLNSEISYLGKGSPLPQRCVYFLRVLCDGEDEWSEHDHFTRY